MIEIDALKTIYSDFSFATEMCYTNEDIHILNGVHLYISVTVLVTVLGTATVYSSNSH